MLLVKELNLLNGKKLNFSLQNNELMIIHGPNGSGKSLLLKSLALLEKASFKEFTFSGKPVQEWHPEEYRSQVLYVPSSTFNHDMTVEEYVKFPMKLSVYKNTYDATRTQEFASQYLPHDQSLKILSMGQRQILSLIRAIHLNAKVLLLDEPTSHLDPKMATVAHDLILAWKNRTAGSVVMVGHDEDEAKDLGVKGTQFSEFI